ncbi:MAG: transglutaminase family protein [Isosphaeraceae bacterium]
MAIRVALHHTTRYQYDRPVTLTPQVVRLRPAPHCRTPILAYSLKVTPGGHFLNWQQDPYSNYLARLVFHKPTTEFSVEVDLIAVMTVINPFDFFVEESAEVYPFEYTGPIARELVPYLEAAPAGPLLEKFVASMRRTGVKTVDHLVEVNRALHQIVAYVIRLEPGIQTCEETLGKRSGSCRDSAWVLVQALRRMGVAARFVSGYLIQLEPDVKPLDGPAGASHDFTDLHAWAEAYLPGAGWVGLDPTSGLLAGEGHIPLACAADPTSASPIEGSFLWSKDPARGEDDRCEPVFGFAMRVTRVHEDPRVTRPYTEDQWQAIDALGRQVDARLSRGDVRLTMGGEPTFVSIDDMEGAEWNTAALGETKRRLGGKLLNRLRDQFAPGGLLHFGQGKWYPGEQLPRWALGCFWRRDGQPVWEDPNLVADESRDYGHGPDQAAAFIRELAARLAVDPAHCQPGYEDVWYYLWRERRLPANVDPLRSNLADEMERHRLAKVFERGLDHVVGYALPLKRQYDFSSGRASWISGSWFLRREHLVLFPGDSPMGYRLPIDSLPWASEGDLELEPFAERDPFAPRGPLPPRGPVTLRQRPPRTPPGGVDTGGARTGEGQGRGPGEGQGPWPDVRPEDARKVAPGVSAPWVVRTALCVEPREGRLHIFMPPQQYLEDYLELVEAVEATAGALGMPVIVEGYQPPHDDRINHFSVTPDPGVIEVNLQPAHSWDELVHLTTTLYEEARQTRLGTEKFMIDGRHTGTGGGNHVVIGGPTAPDSPVLRRPDLLRSLVAYWHNHPSLSYLFSSMFVGPTSQSPRLDEARNDSLYEMEIAFRQIPDPSTAAGESSCPPWLVDRVFRHLLTDVTGNTHRAEFCIDKLYSPDGSSGRRGLVEMRGFEMPPHARMSLVQQLLIRSLAPVLGRPYRARLALGDRPARPVLHSPLPRPGPPRRGLGAIQGGGCR